MKKLTNRIFLFFLTLTLLVSLNGFSQTNAIDSIASLIITDKEDSNKVIHLNQLGNAFMYQNPDTSILLGQQALGLANSLPEEDGFAPGSGWAKGIAISNSNLGEYYFLKGEFPTSLAYHFKALEIWNALANKRGVANSLTNIGFIYQDQGNSVTALEYFFKALKLNEYIGDKNGIARDLTVIGLEYYYQSDYPIALKYFFKAMKIYESLGFKSGIASNLLNIGNVYTDMDDYEKALKFYFKSLKLSEELGIPYGTAMNLGNIGEVYFKQHKYKEAEENLLKAIEISTEIGSLDLIKGYEWYLSGLYSETNRFQLAYEHYKLFTAAKDSLFNEDKSKEIGRLEMRHEIEIAEMERKRQAADELKIKTQKTERRNLLEYSGMIIGLIIIGLFVTILGFVKVKPWVAEGITFFVFLLFFEFLLVLLDPYMDKFTKGEPAYKLFMNAAVAMAIFPLHAFFEKMLKRKLMKK